MSCTPPSTRSSGSRAPAWRVEWATMWKRLAVLVLIATTVGCDRVTKHLAEETLAGEPRQSFLADTVRLEYVENAGAFLALGADWPPAVRRALFTYGSGFIMIGMVAVAVRFRWSGLALVGVSLYLAGGASNLIDRVARGSVIDFHERRPRPAPNRHLQCGGHGDLARRGTPRRGAVSSGAVVMPDLKTTKNQGHVLPHARRSPQVVPEAPCHRA